MTYLDSSQSSQPNQANGETFIQRMKRIQGQQNASTAGVPQQGQQTSPYPAGPQGGQDYRPQRTAGPQMASSGSYGTPVTGDGKIPPPGQGMAAIPGPMVNQRAAGPQISDPAARTPSTPSPGPGFVPTRDGQGWVPANHPLAAPPSTSPNPLPGLPGSTPTFPNGMPQRPGDTNLGAFDLGNDPFSTYRGTQFSTANPEQYRVGSVPDGYQADAISQFSRPDQSETQNQLSAVTRAILNNPESMSPDVVNALKNSGKEDALLQAKQQAMRAGSGAAARGLDDSADVRRIYDAADSNILANNRDIDTTAAQTNFNNRLSAVDAVDRMLSGQMGRASDAFRNTLAGQSAQAGTRQAAAQSALDVARQREAGKQAEADSSFRNAQFDLGRQGQQAEENFRGYQSNRDAENAALNRRLSQFGINNAIAGHNLDAFKTDSGNYFAGRENDRADVANAADIAARNRQLDIQRELGVGGLDIDRARLAEQGRQFNAGYGLDLARFGEGQREFNDNLGFNYNQLTAQQQQELMRTIFGIPGIGR